MERMLRALHAYHQNEAFSFGWLPAEITGHPPEAKSGKV